MSNFTKQQVAEVCKRVRKRREEIAAGADLTNEEMFDREIQTAFTKVLAELTQQLRTKQLKA